MSVDEWLKSIRFTGFRGLPDYQCDCKGRNVVFFGGNGRGKSCIVDGIEFCFNGFLTRFRGAGTGNIREDEAIKHVVGHNTPTVEMHFTPSNATIRRSLENSDVPDISDTRLKTHLENHPSVDSFVLRRSQLLRFISSQAAPRYQMFVRLLGLDDLDATFSAFNEAATNAAAQLASASSHHERLRSVFVGCDPKVPEAIPESLEALRFGLVSRLASLGIPGLASWDDIDGAIDRIDAKRSPKVRPQIDTLNKALGVFGEALTDIPQESVKQFNESCEALEKLRATSTDAAQSQIIRLGMEYFQGHSDATACPLCEQTLADGLASALTRLRKRHESLAELRRHELIRRNSLTDLIRVVARLSDFTARYEQLAHLLDEPVKAVLLQAKEAVTKSLLHLERVRDDNLTTPIAASDVPESLEGLRKKAAANLTSERDALIQPDFQAVEDCHRFLCLAKEKIGTLNTAAERCTEGKSLDRKIRLARQAFSDARWEAIQCVFDSIAGKVLTYYRTLHDVPGETTECTAMELKPSDASVSGSLKFAIEFLSTNKGDPQGYLSEGHLNSLGLCIYLACVKLFNPPGTLLVLDDVLTSIDRNHRQRVADLLLDEFGEFQLIVTTHDEWWFDLLQSAVTQTGQSKKWLFRRIVRWTPEAGPETEALEITHKFVNEHLREPEFRNLGGPLRCLAEDFLKRTAEKLQLKVVYRSGGLHTAGDFLSAGIAKEIRKAILKEMPDKEAEIDTAIRHFFNLNLINALSHHGERRLDVALPEVVDFVDGLKRLADLCQQAKIIKGVSP